MFERFTERARQVVILAQDEARAFKHNYIGTEHLLLGLLREEEGLAAQALGFLDITVERVRTEVVRIDGHGDQVVSGQIPLTPRSKKALELGLREALSLGHNYIGTEHILLGLVRENEGVAARILLDFDADAEKIRNEIIRMLSRPGRGTAAAAPTLTTAMTPDEVRAAVGLGAVSVEPRISFNVTPSRTPERGTILLELEGKEAQLTVRDARALAGKLLGAITWLERHD